MAVYASFVLYAALITTMGEKVIFDQIQIAQRYGFIFLNKFNLLP